MDESEMDRWVKEKGGLGWQVIAVEQRGALQPFISFDDLERIAADDPASVMKVLAYSRRVWESFKDRPAVVYVLEDRR